MPQNQSGHRIVITPSSARRIDFKELFHFRDLFFVLAYRDLRVRYAQTVLGLYGPHQAQMRILMILILFFS